MTKTVSNDEVPESLLTFPTDFPLKIMGDNQEGFLEEIAALVQKHDTTFDVSTIEQRLSKAGNYMSLRVTINATSQEQLDNLYKALTSHSMVKVVF